MPPRKKRVYKGPVKAHIKRDINDIVKILRTGEGPTYGNLARKIGVDDNTIRNRLIVIENRGTLLYEEDGRLYILQDQEKELS